MINLKNSLISISVASLLTACGSSDSNTSTPKSRSFVCQDKNLNSKCDASESPEEVDGWESYTRESAKDLESTSFPLLYEGGDGLRLTATGSNDKISPLTTLIFNEMINNESIGTKEEALTYLKTQFSFENDLSEEQKSKLISRITKLSKEEGFSYDNLNRLVSQAIKEKKFSIDEISDKTNHKLQKKWISSKSEQSITWELSDNDEDPVTSKLRGNTAVIASRFHNSLVVIDLKNNTSSYSSFSKIDGDRFAFDSVTGASEHEMSDIELASNEKDLYVLVKPENTELKDQDKTWGLFKTQIVDNKINDFDNASTIRYSDVKSITDIVLSKDSSLLAAYNTEGNSVVFFDKDLNDLSKDIELNDDFIDMSISTDNKYLFVSTKKGETYKLTKYDLETLAVVKELDLNYSANIVHNFETDELVLFKKEDNKSIFIVNPDTLKISKEINVDIIIKTLTVSGDKLFIINDTINEVLAYDLSLDKAKIEFTQESSALVKTVFSNSSSIYLPLTELGELEKINYLVGGIAKHKIQDDLKELTYETVNHGMPFDITMFDLQLNKSALRGSGTKIDWSVSDTLKEYVATSGINIGKITRPSNLSSNASGILKATVSKEFRGETLTDSKEFNVTIKKEPEYLQAQGKETLGSLDGGGYVFYLSTNGSKVAAQFYGKNTNGNGFKIFTVNKETSKLDKTVQGDAIDSIGLINEDSSKNTFNSGQLYDGNYSSSEGTGMVMKDDKVLFVLSGTTQIKLDANDQAVKDEKGNNVKEIKDNAALMTYDISDQSINDNNNQAKKIGQTIVFSGEKISTLSSAYIGNNLVVLIEGTFEGTVSKKILIYDITNLEVPTLANTIDNVSGKKVALNDDASLVYTLNGSMVEIYDVAGNTKVAEVESISAFSIAAKGDNVFIGDTNGNISIYDKDLVLVNTYVSGYGRYGGRTSGAGHAFGRVEDIQIMNNKIYLGNKYRGLIILDAIDVTNIKEEKVYKHQNYRRGLVSPDGKLAIAFYYHGRNQNDISFITLDEN